MVIYVPGTEETDPKKQNMSLQQLGAAITNGLLFTQNGTGAVARSVDSKLKDVVSVKDFGAVGDGSTNDYAAIVAADVAAAAAAGRTLYFPSGTYNIAGNTYTPSIAVRIMGENYTNTAIRSTSATAVIINCSNSFNDIENLQIASTVARTAGASISLSAGGAYYLNKLSISAPFIGIAVGNVADVLMDNVGISDPVASTGIGIEFSGGLLIQMRNVTVNGTTGYAVGVNIASCGDITMVDCNFLLGDINLRIAPGTGQGVTSILSIGCWFDQAVLYNVLIAPSGSGQVHRCHFTSGWACGGPIHTSSAGVSINASGSTSVNGITIDGMDIFGCGFGISADGVGIDNLLIQNNKIAGNTTGVNLNDVDGVVLAGNKIGATGGFLVNATGLVISGSSDNITIGNNDLSGNTTATSITTSGLNISWSGNLGFSGWRSFTPAVSSGSGSITTLGSVSGGYLLSGKMVFWRVAINITTNGTGATDLRVTNMPFTSVAQPSPGVGRDNAAGPMLQSYVAESSNLLVINRYDNVYPAVSGSAIFASGCYEAV